METPQAQTPSPELAPPPPVKVRPDSPPFLEKVLRKIVRTAGGNEHKVRRWCTDWYREVPEVAALKGVGKGKTCFIVGNGPSLNKLDLSLLQGYDTFCVNAFFLKFPEIPWRPTYYVVEDKLVAQDRSPWINQLRGFRKFFPKVYSHILTKDEDTTYINFVIDYSKYENFPEFSTNAAKCVWVGGTVTYISLQLAFYFGYETAVLIGVDHNYVVDQKANDITGPIMKSKTDDINHFHPDYFGKGFRWHDPQVDRMEKGYRRAREVYEAHGRRVLNATAGGHLEVFERVDFNSLFQPKP